MDLGSGDASSLEAFGNQGIEYVDPGDVLSFQRTILSFLDDSFQGRKAKEALALELPTWSSFATNAAAWIERCREHRSGQWYF